MKPLVLTSWLIAEFVESNFADLAVTFFHRFNSGPLPSTDEIEAYLGPCAPDQASGTHWSDFATKWGQSENRGHRDLALAEFCQQYETVELWFDTRPYAQLQLVWLLDHFSSHPKTVARLKLRLLDLDLIGLLPGTFEKLRQPIIDATERELATASAVWQAYRLSLTEFGKAVLAHEEDFSRHNPIDRWWAARTRRMNGSGVTTRF